MSDSVTTAATNDTDAKTATGQAGAATLAQPVAGNGEFRFGRWRVSAATREVRSDGEPVKLGARAFDLLWALIERRERIVGKEELLACVWPGTVVEENNLQVQVSTLRRLFGPGVITTIAGRGYRFTGPPAGAPEPGQGAGAEPGERVPPSPQEPTGNLPPQLPALYGREADLDALQAAVENHGLVTLVGTGGLGKTTLARALAHRLGDHYPEGCWIAEFAPLTQAALVPGTVAAALQLPVGVGERLATLVEALRHRRLLLVLDNCEHLVDALAALVAALRAAAPGVRVLATSQVPLKLPDEHLLRLAPLALPESGDLASARQAGAVALFEARARAADPQFMLTPANLAAVVEVCRRLDGIALAIELAAARVPLFGVAGLRDRLVDRFRVLTQGWRSALPRHQTLRAALDWSHALLSDGERAVFRRLGVFAGGFTLDAAQTLAADETIDAWAVLDLLGRLVERSLVATLAAPADGGARRFTLLESLRAYALEQLAGAGEQATWQARHARQMAAWAEHELVDEIPGLPGHTPPSVAVEHDNLRACLDWAQVHDIELATRVAATLTPFWRERGHHGEALRRSTVLLAHPAGAPVSAARGRLLSGLCALSYEQGDPPALQRWADAALQVWTALGDAEQMALSTSWSASAAYLRGELPLALAAYEASLRGFREADKPLRVASQLINIACLRNELGEPGTARPLLQEALVVYRQLDYAWGTALVVENLGEVHYALADFEAARTHWLDSLARFRQIDHQHRIACSLHHLACAELRLGRPEAALALVAEGLVITRNHGFVLFHNACLAVAARIAVAQSDAKRAATLFAALDALRAQGRGEPDHIDQLEQPAALAAARARMDNLAWDQAWAEGSSLPPERVDALAVATRTA